jgi:hypothetical protein
MLKDDKSTKLIIGTCVFNVLVKSSVRVDTEYANAELGPTTKKFNPSYKTKVFLSQKPIEAAKET